MKNILLISTDSLLSTRAEIMAKRLAHQLPAHLVNLQPASITELYTVTIDDKTEPSELLPGKCEDIMLQQARKTKFWLIITDCHANLNSLFKDFNCPILLVPRGVTVDTIRSLTYITDLRYCRSDIVRLLVELTNPFSTNLSITHVTLPGLVHPDRSYAYQFFQDQINASSNCNHIAFHYTREDRPEKAADVLINGLHQDVLAVSALSPSCEALLDRYDSPHDDLYGPLLVFPGY